ncbi:MAG: RNA polymerase sigma factor SigF [Actinomycetes bacterium]
MSPAPGQPRWGDEQRAHEKDLLRRFATLDPDDPERSRLREDLVLMHLPLVRHLARRYRERGEAFEDLVQVGTVGLIKAVDRFDPDRGTEFSTYATPTILGEIKRHFRDRTWAIKVPRRLQELNASVAAATDSMTQSLGRAPTVRELAQELDVSEDEVLDALEARHAYATSSFDPADDDDAPARSLADSLGEVDEALAAVEDRESLRPLLEALPERERRLILLRFFQNKSQSQIADELGISQMHVSRLLARTLSQLREGLTAA